MKRILIVDDHEIVRDGLKQILSGQSRDHIFGEASTYQEAIQRVSEDDWDVVILDLSLGERNGLEVLKEVKHIRPRLPVLVLSMHSEEQYARRAFRAGAAGYITKDSSRSDLAKAVIKVAEGGKYVSSTLAEELILELSKDIQHPPHQLLSDREFEVLRLIASGKTVGEIAEVLSLSDKTISTYRARVLEKMGMKTNAELTYYAIQNGLAN